MIEKTSAIQKSTTTQITEKILWILGISLNQAAAYLAVMIFRLQIPHYLVIVFVFTLVFSLSTKNMSRAIVYTIVSTVIGALIAMGILLTPSFACELNIDYTVTIFLFYAAKLMILNLVVGIPSAIVGGLVSEI